MNATSGSRRPPDTPRTIRAVLVGRSVEDVRRIRAALQTEDGIHLHSARSLDEARSAMAAGATDAAIIEGDIWLAAGEDGQASLREAHPEVAFIILPRAPTDREVRAALAPGEQEADGDAGGELAARVVAAARARRSARRRETMERWVEREARTDHLTGLYNRRAFDDRLHEICEAARAESQPVALIVIDVVGTRTVNDAHGYEVGDGMIRRAAIGITRAVRGADFPARIGGDDFGIILPQGDMELARRIARRIAHQLESMNTGEWDGEVPVEVIFGVASGNGCAADELFAAADQQLSLCKRSWPGLSLFPTPNDTGPSVA